MTQTERCNCQFVVVDDPGQKPMTNPKHVEVRVTKAARGCYHKEGDIVIHDRIETPTRAA